LQVLQQEPAVLEVREQTQVRAERYEEPGPSNFGAFLSVESPADEPIDPRRDPQKDDKGWIPRGVEEVAADQQQRLPRHPAPLRPIEAQDQGEKNEKSVRIEYHSAGSCRAALMNDPHWRRYRVT